MIVEVKEKPLDAAARIDNRGTIESRLDRQFLLQVQGGILALEAPTEGETLEGIEVECDEGDLWQLARYTDSLHREGTVFTGQSILLKVYALLAATDGGVRLSEDMESLLEEVTHGSSNPGQNPDPDDRTITTA